jgi:flagellar FliL protein
MKADPKAEAALAAAGSPKKKKLLILIIGALVLTGGGGAAGWTFLHNKNDQATHKAVAKVGPPVFVPIESFTVNLQPETGDQYLQIAFTLQMANQEQVELIKLNMPKVRSRLLLLLSGKKASELNTVDGKQELIKEIIAQVKSPFEDKGPPQDVTDVLFTSFIIQ